MEILTAFFFIGSFITFMYFFIMLLVLRIKSFKLFWKDRYDSKYEEIWGDRVLLFSPLLFPLKKMNEIVDKNEELKSNGKIVKFLKQVKKLKIVFIIGLCFAVLMAICIVIGEATGATWVN